MSDVLTRRDPIVVENDSLTDVRSFFQDSILPETYLSERDLKRYVNTHCSTSILVAFNEFVQGIGKFTPDLEDALRPVLHDRVVLLRRMQIIADWEHMHKKTHSGNWIRVGNDYLLAEY